MGNAGVRFALGMLLTFFSFCFFRKNTDMVPEFLNENVCKTCFTNILLSLSLERKWIGFLKIYCTCVEISLKTLIVFFFDRIYFAGLNLLKYIIFVNYLS